MITTLGSLFIFVFYLMFKYEWQQASVEGVLNAGNTYSLESIHLFYGTLNQPIFYKISVTETSIIFVFIHHHSTRNIYSSLWHNFIEALEVHAICLCIVLW